MEVRALNIISPTLKHETEHAKRLYAYELLGKAAVKLIKEGNYTDIIEVENHVTYPEDTPEYLEVLLSKMSANQKNRIVLNGPPMQGMLNRIEANFPSVEILVYETQDHVPFVRDPRILDLRTAIQTFENNAHTHFPEFSQFEIRQLERFLAKPPQDPKGSTAA